MRTYDHGSRQATSHGRDMTYCMDFNGVLVLGQRHVEKSGIWSIRRSNRKSSIVYYSTAGEVRHNTRETLYLPFQNRWQDKAIIPNF